MIKILTKTWWYLTSKKYTYYLRNLLRQNHSSLSCAVPLCKKCWGKTNNKQLLSYRNSLKQIHCRSLEIWSMSKIQRKETPVLWMESTLDASMRVTMIIRSPSLPILLSNSSLIKECPRNASKSSFKLFPKSSSTICSCISWWIYLQKVIWVPLDLTRCWHLFTMPFKLSRKNLCKRFSKIAWSCSAPWCETTSFFQSKNGHSNVEEALKQLKIWS